MATEVTIPRLGWNMEEGTFIGWLKSDGQHVAVGEPLFSLEGDKAAQDIESLESGILRIPPAGPHGGEKVTVGTLIGYLVAPGEPSPFEATVTSGSAVNHATQFQEGEAHPSHGFLRLGRSLALPNRSLALALAPGVSRELGVDALGLKGSGRDGRIVERDIHAVAQTQTAPSAGCQEIAVTSVRRTIADRMAQSAQTAAGVTLSTTVDATNLVNLRQQFKVVAGAGDGPSITFTDIIAKLTALALDRHPLLNARWHGDKIVVSKSINIGIAVDTERGLMVPVIRDVPRQTLRQLAACSRDLIERARRGALSAAEMQGGTFTVTNLGPLGIEMFTPLINLPECAILGLGRIQKQVVVVDDRQFVARDRMTLSLTFDHRIVDGAPAARFLQSLSLVIENPSPWLLP